MDYRAWPSVSSRASTQAPRSSPIGRQPRLDFYMRRPVREVRSDAEVQSLLASPPAARLMLRAEDWARFRPAANPSGARP